MAPMYVVFSLASGEQADLKAFELRDNASAYARKRIENGAETADVYEIKDANDARAAKAALEMGQGHFIEAHGRRATPDEELEWFWNTL